MYSRIFPSNLSFAAIGCFVMSLLLNVRCVQVLRQMCNDTDLTVETSPSITSDLISMSSLLLPLRGTLNAEWVFPALLATFDSDVFPRVRF